MFSTMCGILERLRRVGDVRRERHKVAARSTTGLRRACDAQQALDDDEVLDHAGVVGLGRFPRTAGLGVDRVEGRTSPDAAPRPSRRPVPAPGRVV